VIAYSRPFWPLFLHVLGAMTLFGAILAATILAAVANRKPELGFLRKGTFWTLLSALPAYVLMRVFAEVIRSDEGLDHDLPTWVKIGQGVADGGLLILLASLGVTYWWLRSSKPVAGRIVTALSAVYLLLLAVASLAMSGKWG
jgi:hypothetical protein